MEEIQNLVVRKKMIVRTFLWIFVVLILVLSVLSSYTYYATRTAILNTISAQNSSLSAQADNFTQQFYKMVRNYGINVFYSRAITRLRANPNIANGDYIEGMRELRTYASSTDYIHSIFVYNAGENYIYSTLDSDLNKGSAVVDSFYDQDAAALLTTAGSSSPLVRSIESNGQSESVISLLIYEMKDGAVSSSMIINVSLNWLEQFLSSLLGLENTSVFLGDGRVLFEQGEAAVFFGSDPTLLPQLLDSGNDSQYLIHSVNGQKYISFCAHNTQLDWYFIRIISYERCLHVALSLRLKLTLLTVLMALVCIGTGVILFKKLFRPVGKLIGTLPAYAIDQSISSVEQIIYHVSDEMRNYTQLMRAEFLRKLLLFSVEDCPEQSLRCHHILLSPEKNVHLLLMSANPNMDVEPPRHFCTAWEKVLLNGQYVFILQGGTDSFQRFAEETGHSSDFCACACDVPFRAIHDTYFMLQEIYYLRIFLPPAPVYTPDVLRDRGDPPYPRRLESRILSALSSGNAEKAMQLLDEFIDSLSACSLYHVLRSHLKQLYTAVAAQDNSDTYSDVDSGIFFEINFSTCTSLSDLLSLYRVLFCRVATENNNMKIQEENLLVQRTKKYIEENYSDITLSSVSIADREGVSNDYLCDIFKRIEQVPLSKYLTQYRLDRSRQLLRTTNTPIVEIAQMVGFTTPRYFFTVFKAHYGMTPSQYRESAK